MTRKKTWWDINKKSVALRLSNSWKVDKAVAENVCGV